MQGKKSFYVVVMALCAVMSLGYQPIAMAEKTPEAKATKGKTYSETEFLQVFSGKSRQQVTNILGKPERREQSVKPANADDHTLIMGKPNNVNVEMWYYSNVVSYAKKKTYKTTEMTFVNNRCANIAFFNDK